MVRIPALWRSWHACRVKESRQPVDGALIHRDGSAGRYRRSARPLTSEPAAPAVHSDCLFLLNEQFIRGETLKVSAETELAFLGVRTFEAALQFFSPQTHPMARAGHPIPSCLTSVTHQSWPRFGPTAQPLSSVSDRAIRPGGPRRNRPSRIGRVSLSVKDRIRSERDGLHSGRAGEVPELQVP